MDAGDGTGIVVEAIALGDSPRALVQSGGTSRIVRAGDTVGDSIVRAIEERGLVLDSGENAAADGAALIARVGACLLCVVLLSAASRAASISIDVNDAGLDDVIALLAAESGINVVTDASVNPEKITLHLHNVTFDDALRAIVAAHDLTVRREGGIVIVGSAAGTVHADRTVVLTLQHAQPDEIAKEITQGLPSGAAVIADKRTGAIVVTGDDATIDRARNLVDLLDIAPPRNGASFPATQSYKLRYLKPDDVVTKLKALVPEGNFLADEEQNAVFSDGRGADPKRYAGAYRDARRR